MSVEEASSSIQEKSYNEWYWKYFPHYRHIDDPDEDSYSITDRQDKESLSSEILDPSIYEYRDEANRKWWSFFNEYEYRFNKHVIKNKSWWRWFDKNTSVAEMKFLVKLDFLIVLFSIASYWSMNLNQANIANAYVSGMQIDLNMKGDDYSNAIALYNAGAVIFQLVYMYIFPRVPLHYLFATINCIWSLLTLCTAAVQTNPQLLALRFLVGASEGGYFMSIHYLLGSWYKPDEIGRRGGLYYTGQMFGWLTSGFLQARLYENLNGVHGLAGWRWQFLIDGLICLPISVAALYMVPGTPNVCHSLFLTDDEILLARRRLREANIKPPSRDPPPFFNKQLWKNILLDWRIYVLMVLDLLFWAGGGAAYYNGFPLWLQSLQRYTIPEINRLSTIPAALGVVFILVVCFSADFIRSRSISFAWAEAVNMSGNVILAIWTVPESAKWYAFYIMFFSVTISSVLYGWLNDIMRHDPQERSIVLCWCNIFSHQASVWIGRLTFPTSHAPEFKFGYRWASVLNGLLILWVFVTLGFYKYQEHKDAKKNFIILYNSKTGDIPPEAAAYLQSLKGTRSDTESDLKKQHVAKEQAVASSVELHDQE